MRPVTILTLALAFLLLAGGAVAAAVYLHHDKQHGRPYDADMPGRSVVQLTHKAKQGARPRVCQPSDGLPTPKVDGISPRVWVDPDPVGGLVLWRPGVAARVCRATLAHLTKKRAKAFANAVEQAPLPPSPTLDCGNDGAGATVFLSYRGKQQAEVVRVTQGCNGSLSAPDRAPRQLGQALDALGPVPAGLH